MMQILAFRFGLKASLSSSLSGFLGRAKCRAPVPKRARTAPGDGHSNARLRREVQSACGPQHIWYGTCAHSQFVVTQELLHLLITTMLLILYDVDRYWPERATARTSRRRKRPEALAPDSYMSVPRKGHGPDRVDRRWPEDSGLREQPHEQVAAVKGLRHSLRTLVCSCPARATGQAKKRNRAFGRFPH